MMGGHLENLPAVASSNIQNDGTLSWHVERSHEGAFWVHLTLDGSSSEAASRIKIQLQPQSVEAIALAWFGPDRTSALLRSEEPLPATALDRMTCNWLVRRFKAGHRFREGPPEEQAAPISLAR